MKALIIYDKIVEEGGSPDQRDVLEQAKAVRDALTDLGFESATLPFSFDLKSSTVFLRSRRWSSRLP